MTLTIEVAPETQSWLQEEATRRGVAVEQVASEMLDDFRQDAEDVTEARRRLADNEPTVAWDRLKAELHL